MEKSGKKLGRKTVMKPTHKLFNSSNLVIYTDGGARGNPGPAAIGAVIGDKEYAECVGRKTNNEAEYLAVVFALKKAKQLLGNSKAKKTEIELRLDSELVAKQLRREYKVREPGLQPLFLEAWNLCLDFKNITVLHVPRAQNSRADALVNRALDEAE